MRKKGHHCGGVGVAATWNDGSNANWGIVNGYHNCMKMCNQHRDCVGFTHYPTYTIRNKDGFGDAPLSYNYVISNRKRDTCILKTSIETVEDAKSDCYEKSKSNIYIFEKTE